MTYKLTADIGDMSRAEAAALVRAILQQYGSSLVDAEVKRNAERCAGEEDVFVRTHVWSIPRPPGAWA